MSRLGGFARPVKKSCQMRTHHAARGLGAGDRPKQQTKSPMVILERGDHLTGSQSFEHITHAGENAELRHPPCGLRHKFSMQATSPAK